jgi:hypothetical protein
MTESTPTVAHAGAPGTFEGVTPTTRSQLDECVADPPTLWPAGTYVRVGSRDYHWNGTLFASGRALAPTEATPVEVAPDAPAEAPAAAAPVEESGDLVGEPLPPDDPVSIQLRAARARREAEAAAAGQSDPRAVGNAALQQSNQVPEREALRAQLAGEAPAAAPVAFAGRMSQEEADALRAAAAQGNLALSASNMSEEAAALAEARSTGAPVEAETEAEQAARVAATADSVRARTNVAPRLSPASPREAALAAVDPSTLQAEQARVARVPGAVQDPRPPVRIPVTIYHRRSPGQAVQDTIFQAGTIIGPPVHTQGEGGVTYGDDALYQHARRVAGLEPLGWTQEQGQYVVPPPAPPAPEPAAPAEAEQPLPANVNDQVRAAVEAPLPDAFVSAEGVIARPRSAEIVR